MQLMDNSSTIFNSVYFSLQMQAKCELHIVSSENLPRVSLCDICWTSMID